MQYAIVILDGASGEPVPAWEGKTTLETSATPCLDQLAQEGMVGYMQNVPPQRESNSDVACMSLLGYSPAHYVIGRGAIEGAAIGIDLEPEHVALRLNLCSVEEGIMKSYSTDNLPSEEGKALAQELKNALDDETFTLYPGTSFRQILVVKGHPALLDLEYGVPHDNTHKNIQGIYKPKAQKSIDQAAADILFDYMSAANTLLASSPVNKRRSAKGLMPANCVWPFWPGVKPDSLLPFAEKYGKTAALCSAVDVLKGLALMTGIKFYEFEGITDGPTNDFAAQGAGGISMLEEGNEVVIIHVEAPDAAGHDGRPDEKQRSVEQSDMHILKPLLSYAQTHPLRIAVMPDHPTPLSTQRHSRKPVPFVVAGPGISHNGALRLTEREAQATGFLLDEGYRFMEDILLAE